MKAQIDNVVFLLDPNDHHMVNAYKLDKNQQTKLGGIVWPTGQDFIPDVLEHWLGRTPSTNELVDVYFGIYEQLQAAEKTA